MNSIRIGGLAGRLLFASALLAFSGSGFSQLPAAKLTTVFPPGGQAGTTVDVAIGGAHLDHADRMFFSHPGITARSLGDGRRFAVTVAAEVPHGIHTVWVAGHYGASPPRSFAVGSLQDLVGTTGNHSFDKAQVVPPDSVVNGHADKEAADHYKVSLKKGQILSARCLDREIDSRMQGVVVVFDSARREAVRARLGGTAVYRAKADGDCFVKVHDFVFRGGSDYCYRLYLESGEPVDHVLPMAVESGTKRELQLFGARDVNPVGKVAASAPAEDEDATLPLGIALRDFQATLRGFPVRGQVVGLADGNVVMEDVGKEQQTIQLPADVSGRFHPARDVDHYHFTAKKGEVWQVEIVSHRLHGLTDPLVVVQQATVKDGRTSYSDVLVMNDADRNFGGETFNTFHHDAAARLEIKEEGSYRIVVRDQFNSAVADPRRVYRLIVRRPQPDFTLVASPIAHQPSGDRRDAWAWNPILRRGDVAALQLLLFRHDGFGSEIELHVEGLPEGVSFSPSKISGSSSTAMLFLRAGEDVRAWSGPLKVIAGATVNGRKLRREVRFAAINWSIDYNNSTTHLPDVRLADRLVLGVCPEPAPLELAVATGKPIEAVAGGKVKVPVRVARRGDFKAALKVKPHGHRALAKIGDATIKGDTGEVVIDLNRYKLPAGTHSLHLRTTSKGKYRPTSPDLIAARTELARRTATAKPAEDHAKALAEVLAIKTLSPAQKAAVKKESDEAGKIAKNLAAKREAAAKRVKDLAAKLKARDITADFYSMPFILKVSPKK